MSNDSTQPPTSVLLAQGETIWVKKFLDQLPPTDQLIATMKALAITQGGTLLVEVPGDDNLSKVPRVLEEVDFAVRSSFGQHVRTGSIQSSTTDVICSAEAIADRWVVRVEVPRSFQGSLFPELTATQIRLITVMLEESQADEFGGEYYAFWTHDLNWTLRFSPSHPWSKKIGGFKDTDLHTLRDEHYITLIEQSNNIYRLDPKQKALDAYQRLLAFDLTARNQSYSPSGPEEILVRDRVVGPDGREAARAPRPVAVPAAPVIATAREPGEPPVPPPDLELRVEVVRGNGTWALAYTLHSAVDFHQKKIEGPALTVDPEVFAARLFEQIERLHEGWDVEEGQILLGEAMGEWESLGHSLYEALFSPGLRQAYRKIRKSGRVRTIQITTDEPWIPWEMVKPYDDEDPQDPIDDDFLGLSFQLTRWLPGTPPRAVLPVQRLACVVGSGEGPALPQGNAEREILAGLARRHPAVADASPREATFDAVAALLERGGLGLLHFVGHGDVPKGRPDEAKIGLADRPLRARHLSGPLQTAIKAARPLVFLNACRASRQGWALTGLGGWAPAWVQRCGCGAFLAPQWLVKDSLAREFAEVFYRELEAGRTLGEAAQAARRAVRKRAPGFPTWLAYTVYGHPNARLVLGGEVEPSSASPADLLGSATVEGGGRRLSAMAERQSATAPPRLGRTNAPPAPPLFFGRSGDLARLKERLGVGGGGPAVPAPVQVLTAVRGWPGVGKTSLAVILAHDSDVRTAFEGVLWASLGQEADLLGEMAEWGRFLGNDELRRAASFKQAQIALRNLLEGRRMVLILDDVWEPAHAAAFQSVGGPGCAVLVTTRETGIAQALAGRSEAIHQLEVLDPSSALDLLQALASDAVAEHPAECRRLVEDLGCLPLALHVAGRLLQTESTLGWGILDLLRELGRGTPLLQAAAPLDRATPGELTLPTVSALLARSTDRLDPVTRERFRVLGGLAAKPAAFGLDVLELLWEEDPRPTVRELVGRGLLEPAGGGRFQIHSLLLRHAETLPAPDGP